MQFSYLEPYLLASDGLLIAMEKQALYKPLAEKKYRDWTYHSFRQSQPFLPDHVFENRWQALQDANKLPSPLLCALQSLSSEFLCQRFDCVTVKLDYFDSWQNILSRISYLPVVASYLAHAGMDEKQLKPIIETTIGDGMLLYPYHPMVNEYIAQEKLHETHVHLNGSTLAEQCWLRALQDPQGTALALQTALDTHEVVHDLVQDVGYGMTSDQLQKRLRTAASLRHLLVRRIDNDTFKPDEESQFRYLNAQKYDWGFDGPVNTINETLFLVRAIQLTANKACDPVYIHALERYLLIMNQYIQLLVQSERQYGFDQFQKFTLNELREAPEKHFLHRFNVIHGRGKQSQVGYYEGRFAPKPTKEKHTRLLTTILNDYLRYRKPGTVNQLQLPQLLEALDNLPQDPARFELALVAHFIKRKDKHQPYRYCSLRQNLQTTGDVFLSSLQETPKLKQWLRGIDAASNELHTPPEVFAPLFRVCRRQGIEHCTYHVGEDFVHLLAGIRIIDDVMRFLPMKTGDRLGHCTALGIWPDKWAEHMPLNIKHTREDWLFDLLMVWSQLSTLEGHQALVERARQDAIRLANELLQPDDFVDIEQVSAIFSLRHLHMDFFVDAMKKIKELIPSDEKRPQAKQTFQWRQLGLIPAEWQAEAEKVEQAIKQNSWQTLELFYKWLSDPETIKRGNTLIDAPRDYLDHKTMVALQDIMLQRLSAETVIIETLPTSNVRISQYQQMQHHHLFRWLGFDKRLGSSGIKALVSMGSDDPGIFANDLVTDFYHLFIILRKKYDLSDDQALLALATVNERGRTYRFHHKP